MMYSLVVRRSELEKKLKALGWSPTGQASGSNHTLWVHPTKGKLAVPRYDLIIDATAERLLDEAEG